MDNEQEIGNWSFDKLGGFTMHYYKKDRSLCHRYKNPRKLQDQKSDIFKCRTCLEQLRTE